VNGSAPVAAIGVRPTQSRSRQQRLTALTPAWYAGARARVEARATLQQAEELRTVLEELGERLGE
jgi:hypothetical protein